MACSQNGPRAAGDASPGDASAARGDAAGAAPLDGASSWPSCPVAELACDKVTTLLGLGGVYVSTECCRRAEACCSTYYCSSSGAWGEERKCVSPYPGCGNGKLDQGESCDDGNTVGGDGCGPSCQVEANWICPVLGQPCSHTARCGDGVVTSDEACDDGNTASGDGCSANCQTIEPGWSCPVPGQAGIPRCGDGKLVGGETCDDGNTVGGDGCSRACQVEAGFVCPAIGQPCVPIDCSAGLDAQVVCDGGAASPPAVCGDGFVAGDEACDNGSDPNRPSHNDDNAYGGCTLACRLGPYCGDGVINGPEECDDGPANRFGYGQKGCSAACTAEHFCGDSLLDGDRGETCDWGSLNGADPEVVNQAKQQSLVPWWFTCSATCSMEILIY